MPCHPLAGILAKAYTTLHSLCLSSSIARIQTKGWPNGLFLEHLNELFQPVRNFFNQCPFHMLIKISLCVPHKNVILEPFTKPCHENATQKCLLMVNNLLISTEQSTTSWKKLLIDMAEKN